MEFIKVDVTNIASEHICCSMADTKGDQGVSLKKQWLLERFQEGLIFKKGNIRGKLFAEYIPAEFAWCPIHAINALYINCFWISGQFKGKGYGSELLNEIIKDARAMNRDSLVILSSKKKKSFLSDPSFLKHKGFLVSDSAYDGYELLYLPLNEQAIAPSFNECVHTKTIQETGYALYYAHQCPFSEKYAKLLESVMNTHHQPIQLIHITSSTQAQNLPVLSTNYSLFHDGNFITNEILSESKIIKLIKPIS